MGEDYVYIKRKNGLVSVQRNGIFNASDSPLTEHETIILELAEKVKDLKDEIHQKDELILKLQRKGY